MTTRPNIPLKALGLLSLACWSAHAFESFSTGELGNLLWTCQLASLFIGVGLLRRWPVINGIGVAWLMLGVPLWLIDLMSGGEFFLGSVASHVGGLIIGLAGVKRLGMPQGTWWKALLGLAFFQQLARWFTPQQLNVNLAFSVWTGWESVFPSYLVYWSFMTLLSAVVYFTSESGLRRLVTVQQR